MPAPNLELVKIKKDVVSNRFLCLLIFYVDSRLKVIKITFLILIAVIYVDASHLWTCANDRKLTLVF